MIEKIENKKDYEAAVQRCYNLIQQNIPAGSNESDELESLSILVEKYEQKHYPMRDL